MGVPVALKIVQDSGGFSPTAGVILAGCFGVLLNLFLLRGADPRIPGSILCGVLFVSMTAMAWLNLGVFDPVVTWLVVIPILAGLLVGPWAAVGFAGLVVGASFALYVAWSPAWVVPPHLQPEAQAWWSMLAAVTVAPFAATFVILYERERARSEKVLAHTRHDLAIADRVVSLGLLAAGVAHEVNGPLSFIRMNMDLMVDDLQSGPATGAAYREDWLAMLSDTQTGLDRIQRIVGDLHALSREDRHSLHKVDPRAAVESTLRMLRPQVDGRVRIHVDLQEVPSVLGDETRIGQVVTNLVRNAVHAAETSGREDPEVRISAGTDQRGRVVVQVQDTGGGIAPNELDRIFEPFFTTKRPGDGTGLGLPLCRNIARMLGGEIEVDSRLGQGSTFRLCVPAAA